MTQGIKTMTNRAHKIAFIFLSALAVQQQTSCTGTASDYYTSGTGSATLSWVAPTQNTDDSPVGTLNGYTIYYGPESGTLAYTIYVEGDSATNYIVENLRVNTTYKFAISAVNSDGIESDLSNIVNKTITE
jgi:Fibronectin type III domain